MPLPARATESSTKKTQAAGTRGGGHCKFASSSCRERAEILLERSRSLFLSSFFGDRTLFRDVIGSRKSREKTLDLYESRCSQFPSRDRKLGDVAQAFRANFATLVHACRKSKIKFEIYNSSRMKYITTASKIYNHNFHLACIFANVQPTILL